MKKILFFLFMISAAFASPVLVFDFDGVMTKKPDEEQVYSFLHETIHLTRAEFNEIYPMILSGQTDKEFWKNLVNRKQIPISASWGDHFRMLMKKSFVNDEMFQMLDQLKKQHFTIVLFSNMDKNQAMRFQEMGLLTLFDERVFAYEIQASKPNPMAYQLLVNRLNVPAANIIFIDDHLENIEAAKKMGIDAILFESAQQVRRELQNRSIPND